MTTTRANTTARGYGGKHQRLRKQVAALVASGSAVCWRCRKPILPGMDWDLGHDDYDRSVYEDPNISGAIGQQPRGKAIVRVGEGRNAYCVG